MNKWLKGNGYWCPDCRATGRGKLTSRMEYTGGGFCNFYDNCPRCKGEKRIAAVPADIMRGAVPANDIPAPRTIFSGCIEYGRKDQQT